MRRPLRALHLVWWAMLAPVIAAAAGYAILSAPPAPIPAAPAALFEAGGER